MKAIHVQDRVRKHFHTHDYKLDNKYIFGWESDFFCISKSGYCVEVEVKVSLSDFKADFLKTTGNHNKHEFILNGDSISRPNKFYFAFPAGLVDASKIPDKYGIIEIDEYNAIVKRPAKFIHKEKLLNHKFFLKILLDKFYWESVNLKLAISIQ